MSDNGFGDIMASTIVRPNGDDSIEFSRSTGSYNYGCVDEAVASDTDYVYCELDTMHLDYYDTYDIPTISKSSGTINSVKVHIRAKCDTSGRASIDAWLNGDEHPTLQSITTSFVNYSFEWTINPDTGDPWTWDEVASLLTVGIEAHQAWELNAGTFFVSQVYVEVDYDYAWRGTVMDVENPGAVMGVNDENIEEVMEIDTKEGEI
jgi:hypothetical protein